MQEKVESVAAKQLSQYFCKSPVMLCYKFVNSKGKSVPLQAWNSPEGSTKLRFPDFMTTAQGGGKIVSLTHRPHLPQGHNAIGRIMSMKNPNDTILNRTSELPICSTAL